MSWVIWTPWADVDGGLGSAEKAMKVVRKSRGRVTLKMRALGIKGLCDAGF